MRRERTARTLLLLPLRSESLAGVISLGVIERAEAGPDLAWREFARVLRPGGISPAAHLSLACGGGDPGGCREDRGPAIAVNSSGES